LHNSVRGEFCASATAMRFQPQTTPQTGAAAPLACALTTACRGASMKASRFQLVGCKDPDRISRPKGTKGLPNPPKNPAHRSATAGPLRQCANTTTPQDTTRNPTGITSLLERPTPPGPRSGRLPSSLRHSSIQQLFLRAIDSAVSSGLSTVRSVARLLAEPTHSPINNGSEAPWSLDQLNAEPHAGFHPS
jgi:hypothetical protein